MFKHSGIVELLRNSEDHLGDRSGDCGFQKHVENLLTVDFSDSEGERFLIESNVTDDRHLMF